MAVYKSERGDDFDTEQMLSYKLKCMPERPADSK